MAPTKIFCTAAIIKSEDEGLYHSNSGNKRKTVITACVVFPKIMKDYTKWFSEGVKRSEISTVDKRILADVRSFIFPSLGFRKWRLIHYLISSKQPNRELDGSAYFDGIRWIWDITLAEHLSLSEIVLKGFANPIDVQNIHSRYHWFDQISFKSWIYCIFTNYLFPVSFKTTCQIWFW